MSMKYNICKLCKLAGVSRSGYYKWLNGTERFTDRAKENKIKVYGENYYKNALFYIKNNI